MQNKSRIILLVLFILVLQVFLRLPFLLSPLDRDEGLYGYMGQRILAGEIPYRDVFDHKPPVVYYIYAAVIKFSGGSTLAIRTFTMLYGLLTTLAVFGAGLFLFGVGGGLLAALIFAVFSGGPFIQGAFSNTEPFMLLPMVLALLFFLKAAKTKNSGWYFLAGLMSGLAFMIKQVSIFNFLVLLGCSIWEPEAKSLGSQKEPRLSVAGSLLIFGFLIFPIIFTLYFALQGALPDFINCAFLVNRTYLAASPVPFFFLDPKFGMSVIWETIRENSVIWILSVFSLLAIVLNDRKRGNITLALWAVFSFFGMAMGKLFFGHYFIQMIPSLCLLSAYALIKIKESGNMAIKIIMAAVIIIVTFSNFLYQFPFYSSYNPYQVVEAQHGTRSFGIAYFASLSLKNKIRPQDDLFVWAAEPEVYFYLNKKALVRFPYYFDWMRKIGAGEKIIEAVRLKKPRYVLWTEYSPRFPELEKLMISNYTLKEYYLSWKLFERKKQWQK
ncbi:MAG: glycosyltransferase family 39 protein [Candidatus Margulisiibacteriota bacterium]